MKRNLFLLLSAASSIVFFSFVGEQDPVRKKYAETITAADLKKHLSVIASDEYEGRETGKKGQHRTAEYIARQFYSFGIPPYNLNSVIPMQFPESDTTLFHVLLHGYYQNVPLIKLQPGKGTISTAMSTFKFGNDFYYTAGIEDQLLKTGKIVFAGYGIQDSLYKDYNKLDVSGKTVVIFAGDPVDKNGISLITGKKEFSTWATSRRRKSNEAKNRKAAALFIVIDSFEKNFSENKKYISGATLQLDDPQKAKAEPEMPVLYISREMANELLKEGKRKETVEKIIAGITEKKSPRGFEFKLGLGTDIQRNTQKLNSENVLGYVEGTDLKNELLVITAHMDHLGIDSTKTGDNIFNGADDDGSGTVSVIELAKAFALAKRDGHGPRRSILFMCVTGEEKGLLGSKWYTEHPVFPLANTVVDLNTDMIGRIDPVHESDTNYVYVIGSDRLSSELKNINETNNDTYTEMILDYRYDVPNEPNNFYGRSDHYNFAKNNIPIAFFFDGIHADYHKVTDEVSKINFTLMERRSRLVFYDAWEIANRDQRLALDEKKIK